eukprot:3411826-Amphidinium_carterae.1
MGLMGWAITMLSSSCILTSWLSLSSSTSRLAEATSTTTHNNHQQVQTVTSTVLPGTGRASSASNRGSA